MLSSRRRFSRQRVHGSPYELDRLHPAALSARTLFRARVRSIFSAVALLKSGMHNRKIGDRVLKGRWSGMPIFTLTLEERATCPETCAHWLDCYGNKMNWSTRWRHGPQLETQLKSELKSLEAKNLNGFVVRLHILGDFYSVAYVALWSAMLTEIPALRVFGYTARAPDSPIGSAIMETAMLHIDRFKIRFSDRLIDLPSTVTVYENVRGRVSAGIVCPAQTGNSECCATCALCWQSDDRIVFLAH